LAISIPQVALSAFRWRFTAGRLGIDLPLSTALREYYLATFLNQVLPGGVMGDASRAWRHARTAGGVAAEDDAVVRVPLGPAVRAVILERASGQIVMCAVAALSLAVTPLAFGTAPGVVVLALLGGCGAVGLGVLLARRSAPGVGPLASVWRDVHATLLARDVLGVQLATSALVVGSYVAMYVVAARAVGVDTPVGTLLPLVAPVLVSMLIPATVAGWGVREATAAGLWTAVGLTAVDGVAISAAYGIVVLVSSLPGALLLLSAGRGRRADPPPGERDGTEGVARRQGSRSAAG
jgi:uncharacterized membrane protein YbhN (UPF0104 family)